MRYLWRAVWIFLFINPLISTAQKPKSADLDVFLQELFANQDEDINYEEIYENFYALVADPIPLNRAEKSDLQKLYILTDRQISNFFAYQSKNGKLLSIYELQAIPEWDLGTIFKILPFVQIRETDFSADNRTLWQRIRAEKNNYVLWRWERTLETKRGFTNEPKNPYLGSPYRMFMRLRMSHTRDFSLDFRVEKDAGEPFTINSKSKIYGFDYYSGHFALYNKGRIKKVIIGDYRIQIGQGLISSAGFSLGKGAETIRTIRRNSLGILPYGSVTEFDFWRGIACTYELSKNWTFTGFLSRKKEDATPEFSIEDSTRISYFTSRSKTGFHRTSSELAKKNLLRELIWGGNLIWQSNSKSTEIGLTFLQTSFNFPIIPIQRPYKAFDFQGNTNANFGIHYSHIWQNFNFFGETAFSKNGGFGTINGFMASLSHRIDIALVGRKYSSHFHNFYGNSFGENTTNKNEVGAYLGFKYTPNRRWQWVAYYDRFRFPWLKFRTDSPSEGYEFMTQVRRKFSRTTSIYFRFRTEQKERNLGIKSTEINILTPSLKNNYQFNLDYSIRNHVSMRSRVQWSDFSQENGLKTKGFALIQDFNFDFGKSRVSTRFALFDTDDFENRQYTYEKDVLYTFSIPAYHGKGLRSYVLFQQKIGKKLDFWFKYSVYSYQNQEIISSGLEEIQGNRKRDIRFQVRYKF